MRHLPSKLQYERTLPVYNGTVVSDGIIYMVRNLSAVSFPPPSLRQQTDGNGGNGEGLYPNWLPTPAWSAYHESSYGFATMQIFNSTHLFWQMHRLNDSSIADGACDGRLQTHTFVHNTIAWC